MAKTKKSTKNGSWQPSALFLGAVLLVLFLIVACVSWWNWKGTTVSACSPTMIKLSAGQTNGAAGTIYQDMDFTNVSKKTCMLSGFPVVFLYGSDGNPLGLGAATFPQPDPTTIIIKAGEVAHVTVGFPQAGNFESGACSNKKSTQLKVYLPGATTPNVVASQHYWCPGFSVNAFQAGS